MSIVVSFIIEFLFCSVLVLWALLNRFRPKVWDIGLGPVPLINNIYHKVALVWAGYKCETFAANPYYITKNFDQVEDWSECTWFVKRLKWARFALKFLFRYRCVYLYFNGHILGISTRWLWRIEPWLLRLAGVKTVIFGYGGDVQDLRRSPNLLFRYGMNVDYPYAFRNFDRIAARIKLWSKWGDHVTAGCEWVDYQTRWDTLMLAHFSIDVEYVQGRVMEELEQYEAVRSCKDRPLCILHACNHKAVKGTSALRKAVEQIRGEGYAVELNEFFRIEHDKLLREMALADVVADQFVIGWYAMFALEAMSMKKPVLCFLREDLIDLYTYAELIEPEEIPILNTSIRTIADRLRWLCENRSYLEKIGEASLQYVQKHHSTEAVGQVFDQINRSLGIEPR